MKMGLLECGVLGAILDLFDAYPRNNFLHSAVYDIIHQVLTGHVYEGHLNRELVVSLFRDVKVVERVLGMVKENDEEWWVAFPVVLFHATES
jgi:serine/threonine-protein phosphatase 6 regulatory subunit 3